MSVRIEWLQKPLSGAFLLLLLIVSVGAVTLLTQRSR